MNSDNKIRGRFARMAVSVNLDKPLVAQIYIDGKLQRVEYEFLPTVRFQCGKYGHFKESCPNRTLGKQSAEISHLTEKESKPVTKIDEGFWYSNGNFGPWMLVERIPIQIKGFFSF